ncbi:MAG: hypothetical protein J2P57_01190 [Acidimicrobiaceae bacterium]|nr:hypothetical protein [Acidimicrobiaceae bacterium]
MTATHIDPPMTDSELRTLLYEGGLVVRTDIAAVADLVDYVRAELAALFSPYDPEQVHHDLSPDEVARLLGVWKPAFIHSDKSLELVRAITAEAGFSVEHTYLDLPRPRTAYPVGHLTTGIAFNFPWHRDAWYAAPAQQVNWWLPIFEIRPDNAMKFDLPRFAQAVNNDSSGFDYYEINRARATTARQVKVETQARPRALDHEPEGDVVIVMQPGSVLLFSGAQLHASIPNTSGRARYSVDFRTVDRRDVLARRGAPLIDTASTGTSLRDFVNPFTGDTFDEADVRRLYGDPPDDALLVFDPHAGTAYQT